MPVSEYMGQIISKLNAENNNLKLLKEDIVKEVGNMNKVMHFISDATHSRPQLKNQDANQH